jgi:hypothetical protein
MLLSTGGKLLRRTVSIGGKYRIKATYPHKSETLEVTGIIGKGPPGPPEKSQVAPEKLVVSLYDKRHYGHADSEGAGGRPSLRKKRVYTGPRGPRG